MRKLNNWLEAYLEYAEETESARIFHQWVGISVIASTLQKNVYLDIGRIKIYPNFYIVLVAEPGIARKSQAIIYGKDIMKELGLKMSSDAITREAMISELAGAIVSKPGDESSILPNQKLVSSLSIVSKEFESFLGQKTENRRMIVFLTDLYDAPDEPWTYNTRGRGEESIPPCCLNILGGTTPDSLSSQLPTAAIGGGLTSRIMFICADTGAKKVPFPELTTKVKRLQDFLIHDLSIIQRMSGVYTVEGEVREYWKTWYNNYDQRDPNRLCGDPTFNGWYSRKPTQIQKLAQVIAASKRNEIILKVTDYEQAIKLIEEAEVRMEDAFTSLGRSEIAEDISKIMSIIEAQGEIREKSLMQLIWRDVDARKFDNVMDTILKTGKVYRDYRKDPVDPNRTIIVFVWRG
jgi:hypothetical protein